MVEERVIRGLALAAAFAAFCGTPNPARSQEPIAVESLPPETLPEPPRLTLPPRDCFSCPGPAACSPRLRTHSGYLYYNTYPIDDDPFNEFGDCPGGDCGYPGAALSLWWIGLHDPRIVNLGHRHQRAPAGPLGPAAARSGGAHRGGASR